MVCLKLFKGCLPQFLLGPILNTLSQIHWNYRETVMKNVLPDFIFRDEQN